MAEKYRGLVLSLFPGADLFSRPFEERGFCVVRGPEKLLGQDIRGWHAPAGKFDGVIGGPPCQPYSSLGRWRRTPQPDLIPEFVRIVAEAKPAWAVMENVPLARRCRAIPSSWTCRTFRDWDAGGLTQRQRSFWLWPDQLAAVCPPPPRHAGKGEYSVIATMRGAGKRNYDGDKRRIMGRKNVTLPRAGKLQGFPRLGREFEKRRLYRMDPMTKELGVRLLGNGVPRAMGSWVADAVVRWLESRA